MAFDGITIAALASELNRTLLGGRVYKIAQPETDELLLTIKTGSGQYRLLLSADASLPLVYLTDKNKPSPMTAPGFCMLLRKHLQNARIVKITQPGLERCLHITMEHLDEMGDLCQKDLILELMGKHSNLIFCNDQGLIIDSIKHVSAAVSSVREVLPGRNYFLPETQGKKDPLSISREDFMEVLTSKAQPAYKALYTNLTGLSSATSQEICHRAKVDGDRPVTSLSADELEALWQGFTGILSIIKEDAFAPCIAYENGVPAEFAPYPLTMYSEQSRTSYDSISKVLEHYYEERATVTRIRQKSTDLRRIVATALERNVKKYDLQIRQMQDTEKRDKFKVYGELINTYGYGVEPGAKSMTAFNYYTNEDITIPLDETLSPSENAQHYFEKYNKLKRTYEALSALTEEVKAEIEHLESISNALDIAMQEEDLVQIREELIESGYIRRKGGTKKIKITSKPFHYISSDGFHIYVGKNNYQNDELTFKFATGNDWWFHAKKMPGSHVVVKAENQELPDRTFEEAARLAAFYSKGKQQDKVEVDYLQKKNVKKPAGAKPGFVVYYTNYSMVIDTDISGIQQVVE